MKECIFCEIVNNPSQTTHVYEDGQVVAFKDLNPQAPYHVLIIPRKHIATLNNITSKDEPLIGHLFSTAKLLAQQQGFSESGYRTVFNCNKNAGQVVFHLHLHLLAGRLFHWPPG